MINMFLFRGKNRNQSTLYQTALNDCLLPREDFLTRMRQERLRSERYETPLSLIIVDVKRLPECLLGSSDTSIGLCLKRLIETLRNSTREYDIKGWYQERQVGILTPNTDESGARALIADLTKDLSARFELNGDCQREILSRCISLSSLPSHGSYLANGDGKSKAKVQPSHVHRFQGSDVPSSRHPAPPRTVRSGTADLAVMNWPICFEVLSQEQVRELQLKVKRVLDIVGALVGIIFFAPVMLVIALLIKLTSPGPVLFRQTRYGFLGKPFTFLKFRSMKVNCDQATHREYVTKLINGQNGAINKGTTEQPVYKINDDPRITRLGQFLRKTSLDELPQFFNVLKGEMSLVGPRPPIPYECDMYRRWHCRRVLEVKPGITGLWQVSGRSKTTFDDMVRLDLSYVRNWNLWLDVKILLKTLWTVVSTKGGY